MAEYRRKLAEYRGSACACRCLLEFDRREAARPQRQAACRSTDHARRLRADAAAGLCRAEEAGRSVGAGTAAAQGAPDGPRSHPGRSRAIPVLAAAPGERGRIQARLCAGGRRRRADARAGGAGLFVRDRRQRQLRHAVGLSRPGHAADLDRDRLQPAAHHQQRRADRRAGRRDPQSAAGQGGDVVGRGAQDPGQQDRGRQEDGRVLAHGAGHLVGRTKSSPIRRRAGRCTPWCSTSMSARICRPTSS